MTHYDVMSSAQAGSRPVAGRSTTTVFSLLRLSLAAFLHAGTSYAAPVIALHDHRDGARNDEDPEAWVYLMTAMVLVLLGGAFAGLTIALMGQDEVYLQVIATSGEGAERKNATKVLNLLKKGKHWVLVTLLVGNVITNETLPIVLDRSIGGGYAAAIASTLLVIIFGEIVPQSICVRFGLPIGAWMADFVLILMWIFAPVTWPTAKLLDRLLGEDHGTVYKKAGLKTLVTLHKTLGTAPNDRLNEDEVSIISGVLDLKEKPVGRIMTPMNDVFTLPANAVLDEDMMDEIMREGYSRIPIHEPKNKGDFVGMLLVKMLITYDPEDARKVSDFSLATLPETRPETSCLDIINFFQQGKSHMVLVSDFPGKPYGALGVVTLEDVIEELIGEEIIDESDVYIDVHKAIRRLAPAPTHKARLSSKYEVLTDAGHETIHDDELSIATADDLREGTIRPASKRASLTSEFGRSPKAVHLLMRRKSSQSGANDGVRSVAYNTQEMREHLRSLGPSNAAKQPKASRVGTVTIKTPGVAQIPENGALKLGERVTSPTQIHRNITTPPPTSAQGGIGHDLVGPGLEARDGVQAVQAGYGTWPRPSSVKSKEPEQPAGDEKELKQRERSGSQSSNNSNNSGRSDRSLRRKGTARSGSITEQYVDSGKGVRKMILETSSSYRTSGSSGGDTLGHVGSNNSHDSQEDVPKPGEVVEDPRQDPKGSAAAMNGGKRSKRRSKKGGKAKGDGNGSGSANATGGGSDESTPLLRQS